MQFPQPAGVLLGNCSSSLSTLVFMLFATSSAESQQAIRKFQTISDDLENDTAHVGNLHDTDKQTQGC